MQVKSAFHVARRTGMFPDVFTYGLAVNRLVAGSNPARGAKKIRWFWRGLWPLKLA
jgi:hypothetical protein